jgi:hypothetical protein
MTLWYRVPLKIKHAPFALSFLPSPFAYHPIITRDPNHVQMCSISLGLTRTVYVHRIWPYIWWLPCQKYRIYTVHIWFWPTPIICAVLREWKPVLITRQGFIPDGAYLKGRYNIRVVQNHIFIYIRYFQQGNHQIYGCMYGIYIFIYNSGRP